MSGGIGGVGNGFSWNFFASKPEVVIQKKSKPGKEKSKVQSPKNQSKGEGVIKPLFKTENTRDQGQNKDGG